MDTQNTDYTEEDEIGESSLPPSSAASQVEVEVKKDVPWWSHNEQVFYNTSYEEHPNAQKLLEKADIVVIFFGAYVRRNTRLIGKYLSRFQKRVNSTGGFVQLIFSSMDENENDCQLFAKSFEGDWLIVPWGNQASRRNARNQCNIIRPPAVVALKNEGEGVVVSTNGKVEILELGDQAYWQWKTLGATPPQTNNPDAM